jgi:glycosyltransferase involved in cell wall biosynthesis
LKEIRHGGESWLTPPSRRKPRFSENQKIVRRRSAGGNNGRGVKLIIVHYHLRPGGIRRIIELATPHLGRLAGVDSIVLACGEAADRRWNEAFIRAARPMSVEFFVEPAFNYVSEQRLPPARVRAAVTDALRRLLQGSSAGNCAVWAHNLGIARNLVLTHELARACEQRGIPLIAHHHDWWFDNRWLRWPEMRRAGVRNLTTAAQAIFPATKTIRHVAINRADATALQRHFPNRAGWLPNLTERAVPPAPQRVRQARQWLQTRLGGKATPIWILPCRLLRRKNVAEALLLARWLRPGAWLVTTGGVSSKDEQAYYQKLSATAHQHHWRLRLGVLAGDETRKPSVAELMAASECVMLTSIQEGFGLPYLEAAAAGRPLIARSLPNIAPDMAEFGFRFPQSYDEISVHTGLFNWPAERARQAKRFGQWKRNLPAPLRKLATDPVVLAACEQPATVPFSRLSLDAQLEVLAQPAARSWELCAPLNPFLTVWRKRAGQKKLQVTRWPRTAERWLGGRSYAENMLRVFQLRPASPPTKQAATRAQAEFFQKKLAAANNYPLLWEAEV